MKTKSFEEVRNALLVAKEIIEENLEKLNRVEDAEEETVTLQLAYYTKTVQKSDLCTVQVGSLSVEKPDGFFRWAVATRRNGLLANKAFSLNEMYDWQLVSDKGLCLVPTKKEK